MREGLPSLTAFYVAYTRALATQDASLSRACQDEMSALLLPAPLRKLLRVASARPRMMRGLRKSGFGMAEHLALRTASIDDALCEAVQRGVRQLVLLGAGFDARAHRMPQLADVAVFEVDHPSTQVFKRERAGSLPRCARSLRYVPCDFERASFADALRSAGFEPEQPSVWIWEGVTVYLPSNVVARSLGSIASHSAPESRLVVSYLAPPPAHLRALEALGGSLLAALAEPIHSHFAPGDMARVLESENFRVTTDVAPRSQAARYGVALPKRAPGIPGERIVVADKLKAG